MCRKKPKLLAVLLAASLLFQSTGITVMAEPNPTNYANVESVGSSDLISAETPSQTFDGDDTAESPSQVSDGDVASDSSLEAPLFPGLPESYVLSKEQLDSKKILAEHAEDFSLYIEEDNPDLFVEGEVIFLADSEEEAQMIADAFGSELLRFEWGVAAIRLSENRTVAQACLAAADSTTLLPAVWPNYYKELYVNHSDPALKDTNADYQWHHEFVGDFYAWDAGFKGQGVKIGILDTGILASHTEFKGRIANAAGTDTQGHGTHVAGIAAANLDNNSGGAGIAPEASLYIYALNSKEKPNSITLENELKGIEQAIADDVDVINMSLGSNHYTKLEYDAVQKAYRSGIAVFAAAGNDSANTRSYPASYDHVCSIAALQQDGGKSSFSNYNDAVDLAFPGSNIYSTSRSGNEKYEYKDGTSMACPVAVGTAAVILSGSDKLASLKGKTGSKKVDALFTIMKQNTNRSSSKGTGAGTTYLPKVFKLSTNSASSAPAAPAFSIPNKKSFDTPTAQLQITASYGVDIYYSTNGKTPTYKNGTVSNGTLYTSNITIGGAKSVTVKAIAVNTISGKASKVASATYTFAPTPAQVEIIADSVDKLALGTSVNLKAAVTPSYAVSTKVKWAVSPAGAGVTINASGKLSVAKTATSGAYTITATAIDKKGNDYMVSGKSVSDSIAITVIEASANIKSIALSKKTDALSTKTTENTLNLAKGITINNAEPSAEALKNIVWSSSNTKVATVTPEGLVTAVAPGQANIKATANDGSKKSATCKITVADSLVITGSKKLAAGKSITLKAALAPNTVSYKSFVWEVSGTGVTVKNGKLTASKSASGKYTVTAKATKDSSLVGTYDVTIVSEPIQSISLVKNITLFNTGVNQLPTSTTLKPEVKGGDSTAVTYTSSAPGVATVDENGVVHAIRCGKAKITCQATDGSNKKAVCNVTVNAPASRVTIVSTDDSDGFVCVGSSIKLAAVMGTSYGTPGKGVEWSVTKGSDLITVDKNGVVKANSMGNTSKPYATAYVTATASDGSNSGTYEIHILPKIKSVKLEPAGISQQGAVFMVSPILDNGKEPSNELLSYISYKVDVSISGNYKLGINKAIDGFCILANKSTTTKTYSTLFSSTLFTTDGTKIKVKVTLPSCKKSASLSGYHVQFSNGYAGFFTPQKY